MSVSQQPALPEDQNASVENGRLLTGFFLRRENRSSFSKELQWNLFCVRVFVVFYIFLRARDFWWMAYHL